MQYVFLGGAGEVGASCLLIKVANRNILIDCGVRVNETKNAASPDLDRLRQLAPTLDAIFISHAHADHVGALPLVHKMYPSTPIYATLPTAVLSVLMLESTLNLRLAEILANKINQVAFTKECMFSAVDEMLANVPDEVSPDEWIDLGWEDNWAFRFIASGHILGAVSILLQTPEGRFLYTGDVSAFNQRVVDGIGNKLSGINPDFMWCESTYGESNHPARTTEEQNLARAISDVIQEGGNVLIPSFALGRAQEIILIIVTAMQSGRIPAFPVVTDGLVNKICRVYGDYSRFASIRFQHWIRRNPRIFSTPPITPLHPNQRQALMQIDNIPKCVIASSGMLIGGASVEYAKAWAGDPKNAIFLSGYQDGESTGGRLRNTQKGDYMTFSDGQIIQVNCKVEQFHLSAHSDQGQLIKMIKQAKPKAIALAHGNREVTQILQDKLSKDFPVTAAINTKIYNTSPSQYHTYGSVPLSLRSSEVE